MSYFHVADCKASASKAAQMGAKTLMAANEMPDVGVMAVLSDPQGAVFALYEHLKK
jgi:predicted enzyme related to lactoylglutathione lyase